MSQLNAPNIQVGASRGVTMRPAGEIPNAENLSGMDRQERHDAKSIADFFWKNYQDGLARS